MNYCNSPVSFVHGISQARTLKWVTISFSRGSSWSRDWTYVSCIGRYFPWRKPPVGPFTQTFTISIVFSSFLKVWLSLLSEKLPSAILRTGLPDVNSLSHLSRSLFWLHSWRIFLLDMDSVLTVISCLHLENIVPLTSCLHVFWLEIHSYSNCVLFSSDCFNIICFYFPAVNYGVDMDLFKLIFFGIYLGFWGLYICPSSRQEFLESLFLKDSFSAFHSLVILSKSLMTWTLDLLLLSQWFLRLW